eukprot:1811435-Prorocentrum_lima.AAC.1
MPPAVVVWYCDLHVHEDRLRGERSGGLRPRGMRSLRLWRIEEDHPEWPKGPRLKLISLVPSQAPLCSEARVPGEHLK